MSASLSVETIVRPEARRASVEAFWDGPAYAAAFERLRAVAGHIGGDVVVAADLAGLPHAIRR
ncbi:MAG: hypothetical protein QOD51_3160, partial [Candidatus Eremiobacteraeota bacterium]|nr:hypothetical protein [Candidatus Eremiobacteraeota bacterium]